MSKVNSVRTPSRPSGQATKLSRSSKRRLVLAEPPSTPNFILRKRYFDIMERLNAVIMADAYAKGVDDMMSAEVVLEKYVKGAMKRNGSIHKDEIMDKDTFERFMVADMGIRSWDETDTDTIYKYHSSSSTSGDKDDHCCMSINLLLNTLHRWRKCNGKEHDMQLADPKIKKEMSSSRLKAVKQNISANAIKERAAMMHKIIEDKKIIRLNEKWKGFQNRIKTRQLESYVSPAKQQAIDKFEVIMKKLKKKRMRQSGKKFFDLEQTFKEIDESGDGTLNRDELNIAMSKLDVPLSEAELDEFMLVLDPDGSGEVEICEFAYLYYNRRKLKHGSLHSTNSGPSNYSLVMAEKHQEKLKRAKLRLLKDKNSKMAKLEQKWKDHEARQKNRKHVHKLVEKSIVRDTLFECFVNHLLANKRWREFVIKKLDHFNNLGVQRLNLEEFLEIIIYGDGHGEFVSQKTREAIIQVMNPDTHSNTVDINDFKFIVQFQAKKNNIRLGNSIIQNETQIKRHKAFNARTTREAATMDKEEPYGTAYIMILKALDLKPIHTSADQVDSYVNVQLNNEYVGNTSTIWQTVQPEYNYQFSFPIKSMQMANTLKIRVHQALVKENAAINKHVIGHTILPLKEYDNGMSNDQWVSLKEGLQKKKNGERKNDSIVAKKYKSMLRFVIRIVRNHIDFDSKKRSRSITNACIKRYMIKCDVNGSILFVSMSDGVILFLSRVSFGHQVDECRFVVVSSFPLWGCLIKSEEKDRYAFKILLPTGAEYRVEILEGNNQEWLRDILHEQYEYLRRLGLPTPKSMIKMPTLFQMQLRNDTTDDKAAMFFHYIKQEVNFGPGRLGLELRQRFFHGNEAKGAIIQSFKPSDNGGKGQALKSGKLEISMSLYSCNDIDLYDCSFQKISECLQEGVRPYVLTFIPERKSWETQVMEFFRDNIFFPCIFVCKSNRSPGWLTVFNDRISFVAMGILNEGIKDIHFNSLIAIEVQDMSFIRVLHIYTETAMYRFSCVAFPNLIKQYILEAKRGYDSNGCKSNSNNDSDAISKNDPRSSQLSEVKKDSFAVVGVFGRGSGTKKTFYEKLQHKQLKGNFCMKILPVKQAISDEVIREISMLEHISHPYLQRSYAIYNCEKCVAVLMDYLPRSLRDEVNVGLPPRKAIYYGSRIFSAMEYLHSLGIVHRGFEIDNVLITNGGIPRLVEFKNSKYIVGEYTYTMCGSPEHMAPSRLLGRGHGLDSDLWMMGTFLYELYCNRNPFYSKSDSQLYKNIMSCSYLPIKLPNEGVQEFISVLFQDPRAIDRTSLRKMKIWHELDWKSVDLNISPVEEHAAQDISL